MSDETKEKLSKIAKERYQDKTNHPMYNVRRYGEDNPFYGKQHTKETKEKISEAHKGLHSGEKNPMYGKNHTIETREKMSKNHVDFSNEKHPRSIPVYCIELDEIFWGTTGAYKKYGINYSPISACCKHKNGYHSAGRHPETNEPLHWMYTSEAISLGHITQQQVDSYFNELKKGNDIYG